MRIVKRMTRREMRRSRSDITKSAAATRKLGQELAGEIVKTHMTKKAKVLTLQGELGSGKTTFIKGFAKGLGIKGKIQSPTFIIIRRYKLPRRVEKRPLRGRQAARYEMFFHIDCYRTKKPKDILDLRFKKIIADSKNVVAVEWPERVKSILPRKVVQVKFKFIDKNTREIIKND